MNTPSRVKDRDKTSTRGIRKYSVARFEDRKGRLVCYVAIQEDGFLRTRQSAPETIGYIMAEIASNLNTNPFAIDYKPPFSIYREVGGAGFTVYCRELTDSEKDLFEAEYFGDNP